MTQGAYEICGTSSDADGFSDIVSLQRTENKVALPLPKDVSAPERSQKSRSKCVESDSKISFNRDMFTRFDRPDPLN